MAGGERTSMNLTTLAAAAGFICMLILPILGDDKKPKPTDKSKKAAKEAKSPPPIYDEKTDAQATIKDALASAKKENRRVLIQWGANWCPWCHRIHRAFETDKS